MVKDTSTEQRIVEAARRVFLRKGMAGARMQEIADEAVINKALLHYYFRSKDKLFDHILDETIERIAGGIKGIFSEDLPVVQRLHSLVDVYIEVLLDNRYLPLFVLNEINHNPDKFATLIKKHIVKNMGEFIMQVDHEIKEGLIRPVNPIHLLLNVLGMIIFPFAAFPLLIEVAGDEMKPFADRFMEERKTVVKDFITHALSPDSK